MSVILTVRQLTAQIKHAVEAGFPYVWVQGEVTNVSRPASGHVYFSLKDENAQLQAVWFKGNQRERETFDPLTGEVFENGPRLSLAGTLRNGQQVICAGRLTVYAPRGGYQLVVELVQDSGEGQLHLALEALRRKLDAKGYFSLERKRPLPEHPRRITVITAPRGAAIRDFLRLSGERGTGSAIRIHPVPVQGDEAPPRIVDAIAAENREGWAEVLVLIRGGGSLQDLWAFNDERVADAVHDSAIPVLAGIGHEVDTSIADMVADLRAATPSHAAQLLWPERQWYMQLVDDLEARCSSALNLRLDDHERKLTTSFRALRWLSPERGLARMEERFDSLLRRLVAAQDRTLAKADALLSGLNAAVRRHAASDRPDLLRARLDALALRLEQGQSALEKRRNQALLLAETRLHTGLPLRLERIGHQLERCELRLAALDPEGPLARGYACALTSDGHFVRSVRDLEPGMQLTVKIRDGEADARITAVRSSGD